MISVHIGNTVIGEGMPKICVPIVASDMQEALAELDKILNVPADLIEFRGDYLDNYSDENYVISIINEIKIKTDIPVIYTFRTAGEGGEKRISDEYYFSLLQRLVASGIMDLVDVELFRGEKIVKDIIDTAVSNNVKVIISNHDFEKTPDSSEIINRLRKMQEYGGDIAKMAVMPNSGKDVMVLMNATMDARKYLDIPVITMSMSKKGQISRIAGEVFGSCVTFGTAGKSSAPGQISSSDLKYVLELIHE